MLAALDSTPDEKLTGFGLRLVLSEHVGIPHENQPDALNKAEQVFLSDKPKASKMERNQPSKLQSPVGKTSQKRRTTENKVA